MASIAIQCAASSESRRRHADDLFGGPSIRDFHYLVGSVAREGVEIEMKGMPKGGEQFTCLERFTLPWSDGGSP